MIGGVRPVGKVMGPSSSKWLRSRRDGLEAQHRALDDGRIDDLVRLMRDERETPDESDHPSHGGSDGEESPELVDADEDSVALAREVTELSQRLEARITRVKAETLADLQDLDDRVEAGRFGGGGPGKGGGRRGGNFNAYL